MDKKKIVLISIAGICLAGGALAYWNGTRAVPRKTESEIQAEEQAARIEQAQSKLPPAPPPPAPRPSDEPPSHRIRTAK